MEDLSKQHIPSCQSSINCTIHYTPCLTEPCIKTATNECTTACTVKNYQHIVARDISTASHTTNIALIAGLISGLVSFTLTALLIALFVYRKRKRLRSHRPEEPPLSEILPSLSSPSSSGFTHEKQIPVDYSHPDSPFIISAQSLQIPHLDIPESSVLASHILRRSLNLHQTQPAFAKPVNRSSSVKLTKYDYYPQMIPVDTELRRAVSVKKNNSTASHTSSVTRIGSVHSDKIVCAKPMIVHIRRKEDTKKIETTPEPFSVVLSDPTPSDPVPAHVSTSSVHSNRSGSIQFYFCPSTEQSQVSIQSNSSAQSTLADGEITIYYNTSS
ncbi:hypothetical protein RMCBS344292_14229 [Rhizopus microsporus]|nr:hypothetical protein RMCBS344292_14229 [Rhizopus microsporus]